MLECPIFCTSITPQPSTSEPFNPTLTIRPNADIGITLSTLRGYTLQICQASTANLSSQLKYLSHLGHQSPCVMEML